jgi:two-component system, cell cycle sensor histidine kinase and response regulator CckA
MEDTIINGEHHNHRQITLFAILAILGLIAEFNNVQIPYTDALIDGRWAFGFMGFALLRRWWAAALLMGLLSIPFNSGVPFWMGFGGNLLYAVPSLWLIRSTHRWLLARWKPDWVYGVVWLALVLFCYQAFTTPAVWAVVGLLQGAPVGEMILDGWRTQPFLVESILVAILSATAMVAVLTYEQLQKSQQRLDHINRVLLGIRNVNQLIVSEEDPRRLIERACVNLTETMGYLHGWIALLDEDGRTVVGVAASGLEECRQMLEERMARGDFPRCMAEALERREIVVVEAPELECLDCPVLSHHRRRSALSQRLAFADRTYGVLTVSVPTVYVHDAEEQDLFNEVAGDLAFALHKIETANRLRASERRYRKIFEGSRDGFVVVAPTGRILDANRAYCDMLGYSLEELRALDDFYRITPARWREWEEKEIWEKRLLGQGYSGLYEKEYIRKDGAVFPVELRSYAARGEDGAIEYLWGTARDITERKQVEETLRQRQAMLTRTERIASVGSWEWDIQEDQVRWSEELFRIFQRDIADGAPAFAEHAQLYVSEDMERLRQAVQRCMTEGAPYELELRAVRADGAIRHCVARGQAEVDGAGRIYRLGGSLQDITDRKWAEAALAESERFLNSILESIQDGVSVLEPDLIIRHVNGVMNRWYSENRPLEGKRCYEVYQNRDCPCEPCPTLQCLKSGKTEQAVVPGLPDSDVEWLELFSYPIADPETGQVTGVVEFVRDITERMQAVHALQESEHRFRSFIENANDIVYSLSPEGVFDYVSPNWADFVGEPADEVIGKTFEPYVHADDLHLCREFLQRVLTSGQKQSSVEYRVKHRDGSWRWHVSNGSPLWSASGEIAGYMGIARDITERKQAEAEREKLREQLVQAQKLEAVGRLAGGVAHDFNNMLLAILGYTGMALDQTDPAGPLHADLREIEKAARRSADLTRQLLAFARKQTVSPRVLDLNETIEGMLKMLHRLIGENIHLVWLPGANLWSVKIDPSQIDQILANLCVNARDAIAGVGRLTIETENVCLDEAYCEENSDCLPGHYVQLAVSDSGRGMDASTRAHLFEPFFTTKAPGEGTGLGLSTIYGIVKQNEGFIHVYSEPGQGSTFRIYLPRYVGKESQPQATGWGAEAERGHETVLLVEDEPTILRLGRRMLESLGYHVLTAGTPGEAIALAEMHPGVIHLLMTDVVMPEMNGRDLAERLLTLYPKMKRIFMSGYTANIIAHQGVLDKGVHFIQKPFSREALATGVRQALEEG